MSIRVERIRKTIKEELSLIFMHKLKDPLFALVTITDVKLTPDIKLAKIYLSVFEKDKREAVLEKLDSISKLIRTELAHRIKIKFVPEIVFYIDKTSDYVQKIEDLLEQVKKGNAED